MEDQLAEVFPIRADDRFEIHEGSDGSTIVVTQGKMQETLSEHDIQIILEGEDYAENFNPSHAALFKDLHQKRQANRDAASRLFDILEEVYRGADPDAYLDGLAQMDFAEERFAADVTVYLTQLMMIEQEINFGPGARPTNYNPPRDLLMACIRWIFSGEYDDIGEVIGSASSGFAPYPFRRDDDDEIWKRT